MTCSRTGNLLLDLKWHARLMVSAKAALDSAQATRLITIALDIDIPCFD
jgi:hypothetical protein